MEFISEKFQDYCKAKGIKRHKIVPGNPQQNGVVKIMKRTLLERVRYMLLGSGLPGRFWGEAVVTATHLINKHPSTTIEFKTDHDEKWNGKPPNYLYLKIFSCLVYAHVGKIN